MWDRIGFLLPEEDLNLKLAHFTLSSYLVMDTIWDDPMPPFELRAALVHRGVEIPEQTLANTMVKLERQTYVKRKSDGKWMLTKKGKKHLKSLWELVHA